MDKSQGKGREGGEVIRVDFQTRQVKSREASEVSPNAAKLVFFSNALKQVVEISVVFDPRALGVKVHDIAKTKLHAVLGWSHDYGLTDFTYDLSGVGGTLSIRGVNEYVYIPWEAVGAICDLKNPLNPTTSHEWPLQLTPLPIKVVIEKPIETPVVLVPSAKTRIRETLLRFAGRLLETGQGN